MFLSRFTPRCARPSSTRAIRHLPMGHAARRRLRLEPLEERLALSVTAVELAKLTASDGQAEDRFGHVAISADGNMIAVGAPGDDDHGADSGSAYVYSFDGTTWQETKLTASDGQADDGFGAKISISADGHTIAIGARKDDDHGAESGSVYVYRFDGADWQETKITASDGDSGDYLGSSVSVSADGNAIAVGAAWDDDQGASSGSAYVYSFNGTTWQETKITASDGSFGDVFGCAVSVSADGQTIVVGTCPADIQGAAYVYNFDGTTWQETKITASDGQANDAFGRVAISADGNTIVVGAEFDDDRGFYSGSAYVYSFDGTTWQETKITASDGSAGDHFGSTVSISADGKMIAVGAFQDSDPVSYSGSLYLFAFDGTTWQETKVTASDADNNDFFGVSLSLSSDSQRIAAGALFDNDNGVWSGSVYVFGIYSDITPPQLIVPTDWTLIEDTPSGPLGITVQDPGTDPNDLVIVASASNSSLIPEGSLTLSGSGSDRTINILPAADQHGGPVVITITATDPAGNSSTATFSVVVTPVNDAPSFTLAGDQTLPEDGGPQSVAGFASNISAGPTNEAGQALNFLVTTDNPALFAQAPAIDPLTGVLTYTPASNANGKATVQVQLQDSGGTAYGGVDTSAPATFTIQVQSAAEQLAGIAASVQQLVSSGALNVGQAHALETKLELKSNVQAQIGATTAFINQVEALRRTGVLTSAQADALVEAAEDLLTSLHNGLGSLRAKSLAARDNVFAGLASKVPQCGAP